MIKFIENSAIDKDKWDATVASSNKSYVYGYSWYLDAVCDHWDGLILDDYQAVLPLPNQKKMGVSTLFQPFFHQCLDIASIKELDNQLVQAFYQRAINLFKINLFRSHIIIDGIEAEKWQYQTIDLNDSLDEIRSKYNSNHRRNIKSAKKNGLFVQEINSVNDFMQLFKKEVGERLHFQLVDYERLTKLLTSGIERKKITMYGVFDENELIAAGVFIIEKQVVTYLKGASNNHGRKLGAMHFLIDQVIEKFIDKTTVFDCGGSNVPSVAEFYKRFGAKDLSYYHYDYVKGKILKGLVEVKRKRSKHGG